MTATPINSSNAIDAVVFFLIFDREFEESEKTKLRELQEILKDELPSFISLETIIESEDATQHIKKSGLKLQRIEPDGKASWTLNVSDNRISLSCTSYDRWDNVWTKASHYLMSAIKLLDKVEIGINALILQYVDRFTENSNKTYSIKNIFDEKNKYLTPYSREAGKLWHVHQGWFEERSNSEKILHVLNIGTAEHSEKIITTINHSLQLQFLDKPKALKPFFSGKKEYQTYFSFLHNRNKHVLSEMLNKKQKSDIGLT